jgi:hypothetical protein
MHDGKDNGGSTRRRSPFHWQADDGSRPSASLERAESSSGGVVTVLGSPRVG